MSIIVVPTTWSDGQVLTASALNGGFTTIYNDYNGSITNANISGTAAIATSKINATFPSGTIVGTTDSQTLSSKTLSNPTVNGSTGAIGAYSPSGGGTATLDLSTASTNVITMPAGNITIALSTATAGKWFVIKIIQDSGGSRTVTWFTTIKWANGGTAPTLTTTANKADSFLFFISSTGNYDAYIIGQNI